MSVEFWPNEESVDAVLRSVPGVQFERSEGRLRVCAGSGVPVFDIDAGYVFTAESLPSPTGAPAARLGLFQPEADGPLLVLVVEGDVAFVPDEEAGRGRFGTFSDSIHVVADMPPVLGWTEVVRCLAAIEGSLSSFDRALAQTMVAAAGVEGARRIGLGVADVDGRLDAAIARVESA